MKDKTKIIYIVIACIAVIACIIIAVKGLNFGIKYSDAKQMQFNIGKEFENKDIKKITEEIIGNQEILIQKVEVYEEIVSITIKDISDEQLNLLIERVNEKYGLDLTTDNVLVTDVAKASVPDMILPYIVPITISLIIILIYAIIKYRDINVFEIILKILGFNVLAIIIYISFLAITRFPIDVITMPTAICIYVIVTYIVFNSFENKK